MCTKNFTYVIKFYVHEIAVVNLSKIYFLKNAKKTCINHDLNRDWTKIIGFIKTNFFIQQNILFHYPNECCLIDYGNRYDVMWKYIFTLAISFISAINSANYSYENLICKQ